MLWGKGESSKKCINNKKIQKVRCERRGAKNGLEWVGYGVTLCLHKFVLLHFTHLPIYKLMFPTILAQKVYYALSPSIQDLY